VTVVLWRQYMDEEQCLLSAIVLYASLAVILQHGRLCSIGASVTGLCIAFYALRVFLGSASTNADAAP